MPKALQTTLLSLRELLFTAGPFVLLAALLLALAFQALQPSPPRKVVLATGVAQGAYAEFGKRYAELLQRHGISVELRTTQGAVLRTGADGRLRAHAHGRWLHLRNGRRAHDHPLCRRHQGRCTRGGWGQAAAWRGACSILRDDPQAG